MKLKVSSKLILRFILCTQVRKVFSHADIGYILPDFIYLCHTTSTLESSAVQLYMR